jgi:hypothetical protein
LGSVTTFGQLPPDHPWCAGIYHFRALRSGVTTDEHAASHPMVDMMELVEVDRVDGERA